jgi:glycosyltransferase involved in cell wall biosynthesis
MKIALVSYEYPPDSAFGGIATYMLHAARMLHDRGHHIEVFSASGTREGTFEDDGIAVHRVKELERFEFPFKIASVFAARHAQIGFDVVESPEYFADALGVVRAVPEIPLVVKLHSPSYMLWKTTFGNSRWMLIRNYFASFRRGELPPWHPHHGSESECAHFADEVAAPCRSTADQVARAWGLDPDRMAVVPNVYEPGEALLKIDPATQTNTVCYIGRLELLKGVTTLAAAIPLVLRENPKIRFRFVGRSVPMRKGVEMLDHLRKKLASCMDAVEFTGAVPLEQIPKMLAGADVCAFPSLWDNFPTVCLEAMAAGRAVIGSSSGGMKEILGDAGRVVTPGKPQELADAILEMFRDRNARISLGARARQRVLAEYNPDRVGQLQEESYRRAIARRGAQPREFNGPRRARTTI